MCMQLLSLMWCTSCIHSVQVSEISDSALGIAIAGSGLGIAIPGPSLGIAIAGQGLGIAIEGPGLGIAIAGPGLGYPAGPSLGITIPGPGKPHWRVYYETGCATSKLLMNLLIDGVFYLDVTL
uniref:Uncharacterized protein n=1 Tax=Cacopsylla melanoneura TaxID=428564 RepID=A0A8D9BF11_9HEMI